MRQDLLYLAPELITPEEVSENKFEADIWSVGIILFEML